MMILWFLYRIIIHNVSKIKKKRSGSISSLKSGNGISSSSCSELGIAKVDGISGKKLLHPLEVLLLGDYLIQRIGFDLRLILLFSMKHARMILQKLYRAIAYCFYEDLYKNVKEE
jgi:uncharacterized protein YlxP (DUF503 family)